MLYHLGQEVTTIEVAVMWDDSKLGLTRFTGWETMAVICDVAWTRVAIETFALAMRGRVRALREGELAEAER